MAMDKSLHWNVDGCKTEQPQWMAIVNQGMVIASQMEVFPQWGVKVLWKQFPTLAKVKIDCVLSKSIMDEALSNVILSFLFVTVKILAYEWMNSESMILGEEGRELGVTQIKIWIQALLVNCNVIAGNLLKVFKALFPNL